MARLTRGPDKVAKSVSSMVVPPELADKIELSEPSYKANVDKEQSQSPETNGDNTDPLGDLPRPKYCESVPLPLIEHMPGKAADEPRPSLKPDHESLSAFRSASGLFASKFNPDKWRIFCQHYAEHGRQVEAARAAGVNASTVWAYRKNHPDFAEMYAEAAEEYKEKIQREVYRRGVEGIEEDVFGKDGKVGTRRIYSDRLLELEAKRVDPTYREKSTQVDLAMTGGVLVVRDRGELKEGEWEKEFSGDNKAGVIEVQAEEIK